MKKSLEKQLEFDFMKMPKRRYRIDSYFLGALVAGTYPSYFFATRAYHENNSISEAIAIFLTSELLSLTASIMFYPPMRLLKYNFYKQ